MIENKRKGAVRRADVPPDILKQLNKGTMEAMTLAEVLVVDFGLLLKNAFPDLSRSLVKEMEQATHDKMGWVQRTILAGELIYKGQGKSAIKYTIKHPSDQVRGWAASIVRAMPDMSLEERLEIIRPIADDKNPGVRETAWIMLRPYVAEDIAMSIKTLTPWVHDQLPNIRRFATEITRPRGVWCSHITVLRKNPKPALPLLEPVRNDPSRYVQNSVANWLNDASKDNPEWVQKICSSWLKKSQSKETSYICKRALRTIRRV